MLAKSRGIGKAFAYINMGVPSDVAGGATAARYALRAGLGKYCSAVVSNYGINNVYHTSQTAAQIVTALQQVYSHFPGKAIFQTTVAPETTSTDSFVTVANQKPGANDSTRIASNTLIRSGIPGTAGAFDIAYYVETGIGYTTQPVINGGLWMADGTNAGVHSSDGIHENSVAAIKEIQGINIQRIMQ